MEIVNIIILEATDMLCNYNTEKLLGLKGVIVKNVRQLPDRTEIFIELPKEPHVCPCCGHKTSHVHDYRQQTVKDIPSFGKHTVLILRKRRYHCSFCGKHFFEEVLFLPRYSRMTSRLAAYIISDRSDVRSCPYTNGFTEGVNNKIKVLKRQQWLVSREVRNFGIPENESSCV